jgi:hypothetical protein
MTKKNPHLHDDEHRIPARLAVFRESPQAVRQEATAMLRLRAESHSAHSLLPALLLVAPTLGIIASLVVSMQTLWTQAIGNYAMVLVTANVGDADARFRNYFDAERMLAGATQPEDVSWWVIWASFSLVLMLVASIWVGWWRDRRRGLAIMWLNLYSEAEQALSTEAERSVGRNTSWLRRVLRSA